MTIVEARRDQEQGFQIGRVLERMVLDEMLERLVAFGLEVNCERPKVTFDVDFARSRMSQSIGQIGQAFEHIVPLRIVGLGGSGDIDLTVTRIGLVQSECAEQCSDDGCDPVENQDTVAS